ncbi:ribulokinase [Fulvitalea axinellae]|uniref:Ribulokinase n=1 Tax=Fulvitalea axinellae TaxID=1182444 RepID=A0AAU9DCW1_9BACT|nr:ribulokinase [Fulvitalea axinellae]
MRKSYAIGVDFGSTTARALLLDISEGTELFVATKEYPKGVIASSADPHLARQDPDDYLLCLETVLGEIAKKAKAEGIDLNNIVGIGTATTGSTPIPVDENLAPLSRQERFKDNPNALAWMWKDHTASEEAKAITEYGKQNFPGFLKICGNAYSSEWFFSKIWKCAKEDSEVFEAASTWLEFSDFVPAALAGITTDSVLKRNICGAGFKAMFDASLGGYPRSDFWNGLAPVLSGLADSLPKEVYDVSENVGGLCADWAERTGLPEGIPVAVGLLDAHAGAIGSGISEGAMVKIIGTSTCDILVQSSEERLEVPGISGVVPDSVIPGLTGLEAGQSAVGDVLDWYIRCHHNGDASAHGELTERASKCKAGESGLLALDWHNGNRNVLTDPDLSGLLIGMTLRTESHEIYRALIEATAFGALRIVKQLEANGVTVDRVINCGGIAHKNPLFMQIYADVMNRPMLVAEAKEAVALGCALIGASIGQSEEYFRDLRDKTCQLGAVVYNPNSASVQVYAQLYRIYEELHDGFGVEGGSSDFYGVMKELSVIRKNSKKIALEAEAL